LNRAIARIHLLSMALLGDAGVGKSSLVRRFVLDQFSDSYLATVGAKPMKKTLRIEADSGPEEVQMLVWDVAGQPGYHTVQERVLKGVQGVVLVYDVTRDETRENLSNYWIPRAKAVDLRVPTVVVGNKLDLLEDRWSALPALKNFASQTTLIRFLTSAKTGERVEDAFLTLAASIVGKSPPPNLPGGTGAEPAADPLVTVTDRIIADFCDEYGGAERVMHHVQREAARAGLDIRAPTWEAVRLFVQNIGDIDRGARPAKAVNTQGRRLQWLWEAASAMRR